MIPGEVAQFLREPARSLVVKGAAGAGKTLFSLAAARWFQLEIGDVVWLNARDAEPSVLAELDAFVPPEHRIDASSLPPASDEAPASAMSIVNDLREELVPDERTLVIVDSVTALAADAPPRERAAFERAIVRLARERGANMVLIVESTQPESIEYLADGVLALTEVETPVGRVRALHSQKLRGAPAALARHPFTLTEGEYWTPEPARASPPESPARAAARPDGRGRISTGTNDWDLILGGGLARGSVALLEVPRSVGSHEDALIVPLVLNARLLGRDVAMLLSAGSSRARIDAWTAPHLPPQGRGALTVVEAGELSQEPRFGDKQATLDERLTRLDRVRARSAGPVVSVLDLDALGSAARREEVEAWLARWTLQTRHAGHVDVLVASAGHAGLAGAADSHWRIDAWEGYLLLRGLAPATEPFFARLHAQRGFPETELRRVQ